MTADRQRPQPQPQPPSQRSQRRQQEGRQQENEEVQERRHGLRGVCVLSAAVALLMLMLMLEQRLMGPGVASLCFGSAWEEAPKRMQRNKEHVLQLRSLDTLIRKSLDRFESVVQAGIGPALLIESTKEFWMSADLQELYGDEVVESENSVLPPPMPYSRTRTSADCILASITCGLSCGWAHGEHDGACWCVKIVVEEQQDQKEEEEEEEDGERRQGRRRVTLSYFEKGGGWDVWNNPSFVSLQAQLNMLQIVMDRWVAQSSEEVPSLVYLVLNTMAYPRQFLPYLDSKEAFIPQIVPKGYPPATSRNDHDEVLQYAQVTSWRNRNGLPHRSVPCITPPYTNWCCNVGRGTWEFRLNETTRSTSPLAPTHERKVEYLGMDHRPFPILSSSVELQKTFDVLAPLQWIGNCHGPALEGFLGDEGPQSDNFTASATSPLPGTPPPPPPSSSRNRMPARIPWKDKTNTLAFPFHPDFDDDDDKNEDEKMSRFCNEAQMQNHIARFCGQLRREFGQQNSSVVDALHLGPPRTARALAKSRFVVLLDGMTASWFTAPMETLWMYTLGCVVLHGGFQLNVRLALLQPHVHYIPFDAHNMTSFWEALERVATNDEYAQKVATNLQRAAMTFLSTAPRNFSREEGEEGGEEEKMAVVEEWDGYQFDGGYHFDLLYWKELLREYTHRFTFEETEKPAEIEDADFTTERQCQNYRQVFGSDNWNGVDRLRPDWYPCLSEAFACDEDQDMVVVDPVTQEANSRMVQHGVHPWFVS